MLQGGNLSTIIVAVVGLLGMWLSHKIAARASTKNARIVAEVESYGRAVKMDRETIDRQKAEIAEFVVEQAQLKSENRQLRVDSAKKDTANAALVRQVLSLQEQLREKNRG